MVGSLPGLNWSAIFRAPISGCRRSKTMPVEKSIRRFRGRPESYAPIPVAEIPRPSWQQPAIDWDDEDVPPLPPRFEDDLMPLTRSERRPLVGVAAALIATLVLGTSLAYLLAQPWTVRNERANAQRERVGGAPDLQATEADLSRRIDFAVASLREDPNANGQRSALIRSLRPDLSPAASNDLSRPTAATSLISRPKDAWSRQ